MEFAKSLKSFVQQQLILNCTVGKFCFVGLDRVRVGGVVDSDAVLKTLFALCEDRHAGLHGPALCVSVVAVGIVLGVNSDVEETLGLSELEMTFSTKALQFRRYFGGGGH
jgi:hypothetical protein